MAEKRPKRHETRRASHLSTVFAFPVSFKMIESLGRQ